MKIIIPFGLLLLALTKTDGQNIKPEDNVIYSKVLNAFLKGERIKERNIILQSDSNNEIEIDETAMWDSTMRTISRKLDSVKNDKITFDQLDLKNFKLIVVTEGHLKELFQRSVEDGWRSFYKKYPNSGGIVKMSKMYLSPTRTWGLVYISISRGGLNGAGYIIKFDLADKKIIKIKERLWIS